MQYERHEMKKRIMIIGDRFYPNKTAISIILEQLIAELIESGHHITYIAINQDKQITEKKNNFELYSVSPTSFGKLKIKEDEVGLSKAEKSKLKLLTINRKIFNLLNIMKFPMVDIIQTKKAIRIAKNLHLNGKFDSVIGVFRPFTGVAVANELGKLSKDLAVGAIYMDLIVGANKPAFIPKKLYDKLCLEGEIRYFKDLDFILMPIPGKKIYERKEYSEILHKIEYFELPAFYPNERESSKAFSINKLRLIYAGILDRYYRNPEMALTILSELSNEFKIHFDIYGDNNLDEEILHFDTSDLVIKNNGRIPYEKIQDEIYNSDFLINIANDNEYMIPSKIFELFSTGKPIINFVSNKNDPTLQYFKQYPLAINLFSWDTVEYNANKLKDFINKEGGKVLDKNEIEDIYISNTPQYAANQIINIINKSKKEF